MAGHLGGLRDYALPFLCRSSVPAARGRFPSLLHTAAPCGRRGPPSSRTEKSYCCHIRTSRLRCKIGRDEPSSGSVVLRLPFADCLSPVKCPCFPCCAFWPLPIWDTPSLLSTSSHRPGHSRSSQTPSYDEHSAYSFTASSLETACKPRPCSRTASRRKLPTSSCTSGAYRTLALVQPPSTNQVGIACTPGVLQRSSALHCPAAFRRYRADGKAGEAA